MSQEKRAVGKLSQLFNFPDGKSDMQDVYSQDAGAATLQQRLNQNRDQITSASDADKLKTLKVQVAPAMTSKELIIKTLTQKSSEIAPVLSVKKQVIIQEKKQEIKPTNTNTIMQDFDFQQDFRSADSLTEKAIQVPKASATLSSLKTDSVQIQQDVLPFDIPVKRQQLKQEVRQEIQEPVMSTNESQCSPQDSNENSQYSWNFISPSTQFNQFYAQKAECVSGFLSRSGGQLPFEAWDRELRSSHIDLTHLSYDLDDISQSMQLVQMYQERTANIRLMVNSQYHWCKRSLQLLQGMLARIAYQKPVQKFKGIIYLHLNDVEKYMTDLQGTRESADIVSKNLDKVSDYLSRRLTVVMNEMAASGGKSLNKAKKIAQNLPAMSSHNTSRPNIQVSKSTYVAPVESKKEQVQQVDQLADCGDSLQVQEKVDAKVQKKPVARGWDLIQAPKAKK